MADQEVWLLKDTQLDLGDTVEKYRTGILANDGAIYCPPWGAAKILRIDTRRTKVAGAQEDEDAISRAGSKDASSRVGSKEMSRAGSKDLKDFFEILKGES